MGTYSAEVAARSRRAVYFFVFRPFPNGDPINVFRARTRHRPAILTPPPPPSLLTRPSPSANVYELTHETVTDDGADTDTVETGTDFIPYSTIHGRARLINRR